MKGVNEVRLLGNIGKDPEMKFTPNGKAVLEFTLATSRKYKLDNGDIAESTQWHNVTAWGNLAENCNKILSKGQSVYVEGRIEYDEWEHEGKKYYRTSIVAGDIIFLTPKAPAPAVRPAAQPVQQPKTADDWSKLASAGTSKLVDVAVKMGAEVVKEDGVTV